MYIDCNRSIDQTRCSGFNEALVLYMKNLQWTNVLPDLISSFDVTCDIETALYSA